MQIFLNPDEMRVLTKQDPATARDKGWQSFLIRLQSKTNPMTGELNLTDEDIKQIQHYAFDYGSAGWEERLTELFERHLGPDLADRKADGPRSKG